MSLLHITGREGVSVPLGSLAQVTPSTGPLTVNHSGQLPSVTLSFNLEPGVSIGTAVERVQAAAREVLPSTISTSFSGTAAGAESRRPLGIAVVGGLAFSQIITLYITPVIYTYLDALQQRFGRGAHARAAAPEGAGELTARARA
jgi:HAE1 family hydrophobic/amphiphilic exporter-1